MLILCHSLADDTCYELGSKLTQKKYYELYSIQQIESIRSSLRNLGTAAIMLRQNDSRHNFKNLSVVEILKTCFNVGIQKEKINYSYSGLYPLDHLTIVNVPQSSIF